MALNTTPYATIAVGPRSLRFFNTTGDHVNAYCAYEDLINCLGMSDWASRISGTAGIVNAFCPAVSFRQIPVSLPRCRYRCL